MSGGIGGGGTSGPPSFNQGSSTFTAGPSYGSSFAGDIIRKPSRLIKNNQFGFRVKIKMMMITCCAGWRPCRAWKGRRIRRRKAFQCSTQWELSEDSSISDIFQIRTKSIIFLDKRYLVNIIYAANKQRCENMNGPCHVTTVISSCARST